MARKKMDKCPPPPLSPYPLLPSFPVRRTCGAASYKVSFHILTICLRLHVTVKQHLFVRDVAHAATRHAEPAVQATTSRSCLHKHYIRCVASNKMSEFFTFAYLLVQTSYRKRFWFQKCWPHSAAFFKISLSNKLQTAMTSCINENKVWLEEEERGSFQKSKWTYNDQ